MRLVCGDCGEVIIVHSCSNTSEQDPGANPAQMVAQPDANGDRRHGGGANLRERDLQDLQTSDPKGKPAPKERKRKYNEGYDPQFEVWYSTFPLKRDKRKAQEAWRRALRRGHSVDVLLAGAIRYANDRNRTAQFTKYPATFLNADSFLDEDPIPDRLPPGVQPAKREVSQDDIEAEVAAFVGVEDE